MWSSFHAFRSPAEERGLEDTSHRTPRAGRHMTWGVAVTLPNQQAKVIEQLLSLGIEYLFPQVKRTVRRAGRRVHICEPLLFNYIPVLLSKGWEMIFDMRGVMDLIGPASDKEIELIRNSCDAAGIVTVSKVHRFVPGQKVVAKVGSFSELVGTYQGMDERENEIAVFKFLGSMQTMKFLEGDLVAA